MKWVSLALEHSYITIGLLVFCLLFFNFPSVLWLIIIGIILLIGAKISAMFH